MSVCFEVEFLFSLTDKYQPFGGDGCTIFSISTFTLKMGAGGPSKFLAAIKLKEDSPKKSVLFV